MATFNKVEKGLADQIAVLKELGDTPKYTAISPTSIELMAASKFIGKFVEIDILCCMLICICSILH
jgi:hypothetical protein